MKASKRILTLVLTFIMVVTIFPSTVAYAATNSRQDALHAAAEILRNDLGYANDHCAVRILSETWLFESGEKLPGRSYYHSSRVDGYYFFANNANSPASNYTGSFNSGNRRQQKAMEAFNLLSQHYASDHPVVVAATDVLAAECGTNCSLGYYYSNNNDIFYYFSGSYENGNNGGTPDNGGSNNTGNPGPGNTGNPGTSNPGTSNPGSSNPSNPGTSLSTSDYDFYAAQNYYGGKLTGTDKYVDAANAEVLAKLMASYCYNEVSTTKQAAMAWTMVNIGGGIPYSQCTGCFPDYNPNAPTTDAWGRDLLLLAKDILFRKNAELVGVAKVGRILPKDYTWLWIQEGVIYYRNSNVQGLDQPSWSFSDSNYATPYSD